MTGIRIIARSLDRSGIRREPAGTGQVSAGYETLILDRGMIDVQELGVSRQVLGSLTGDLTVG
jgi:hypothetical protein